MSLYSIRVKVCVFHLKADEVMFNNELCRFCQKCTKFHNVGNLRKVLACLRSLNRLAFKRVPASAQESALNTLALYDRMIMSQAGTGEAAPNGGANSASATNTDNNKREVSSVLPSNELTRQQPNPRCTHVARCKLASRHRKKEKKENEELQQQSQGTQIDQKTLSVSKLRVIRLQCAQMLLNHLPEKFDPSTNAEERRRREIINASYTRSEGYDRLMHLTTRLLSRSLQKLRFITNNLDLSASIAKASKLFHREIWASAGEIRIYRRTRMHEVERGCTDPTNDVTSFVFEKSTRNVRQRSCKRIGQLRHRYGRWRFGRCGYRCNHWCGANATKKAANGN